MIKLNYFLEILDEILYDNSKNCEWINFSVLD